LEPELAFWSKLAIAHKQHKYMFCVSVATVCLFFFVIGEELTRLDQTTNGQIKSTFLKAGRIGGTRQGGFEVKADYIRLRNIWKATGIFLGSQLF